MRLVGGEGKGKRGWWEEKGGKSEVGGRRRGGRVRLVGGRWEEEGGKPYIIPLPHIPHNQLQTNRFVLGKKLKISFAVLVTFLQ